MIFALFRTLNLLRAKVVVFRNSGIVKQNVKWYYRGEMIKVVLFYKYSGVFFTPKTSLDRNLRSTSPPNQ